MNVVRRLAMHLLVIHPDHIHCLPVQSRELPLASVAQFVLLSNLGEMFYTVLSILNLSGIPFLLNRSVPMGELF